MHCMSEFGEEHCGEIHVLIAVIDAQVYNPFKEVAVNIRACYFVVDHWEIEESGK